MATTNCEHALTPHTAFVPVLTRLRCVRSHGRGAAAPLWAAQRAHGGGRRGRGHAADAAAPRARPRRRRHGPAPRPPAHRAAARPVQERGGPLHRLCNAHTHPHICILTRAHHRVPSCYAPHRSSWPRSPFSPPRATARASCAVCTTPTHSQSHHCTSRGHTVAFNVFDYDGDGFVSNADAYRVCRVLIPSIPDFQLQRLVDRVLIEADSDRDGMLSFDEFSSVCHRLLLASSTRTHAHSLPHASRQFMVENTPDVFEKLTISWE